MASPKGTFLPTYASTETPTQDTSSIEGSTHIFSAQPHDRAIFFPMPNKVGEFVSQLTMPVRTWSKSFEPNSVPENKGPTEFPTTIQKIATTPASTPPPVPAPDHHRYAFQTTTATAATTANSILRDTPSSPMQIAPVSAFRTNQLKYVYQPLHATLQPGFSGRSAERR